MIENNPFFEWLKAKGLSKNTLYLYYRYYKRFEKFPFSQEGIDKFFNQKKVNNSISRAFMKSLLEFLGKEEEFILPPKVKKKKQKIIRNLSQNQIQEIRKVAYEKSMIHGFIFDFLYYGALRRSEMGKIKINSFNWDAWFEDPNQPCELVIEQGKGNKDRVVLLPAHVIKSFLDFYMKKRNIKPYRIKDLVSVLNNTPDKIFIKGNGTELDGWKIWQMIKQISYRAIEIEVRPHELRHARATELENKGHSIRTIQHYLGHSSPQITEVYLHTSERQSLSKIKEAMANEL